MAIIQDETIVASDFINESEKNATPANDEGRVPKLESDAKVSAKFLSDSEVDVVLGETIDGTTTPKAVFIADGGTDSSTLIEGTTGSALASYTLDNTDQLGQAFNSGELNRITKVTWDGQSSGIGGDDNLYIEIYLADGSFFPTGSALASKVFNDTALYDGGGVCTFDTPATVSKNTDYVVVQRTISDTGDTYEPFITTTEDAGSGSFSAHVVTNTGSGWSEDPSRWAYHLKVEGYELLTSGKTYKSSTGNAQRSNFNGFIYESGILDDVAGMRNDISRGFTGLTTGTRYYIGSDGAISTTTAPASVGLALNATDIQLVRTGVFGSGESTGASGITYTATKTGFFYGSLEAEGGTASASVTVIIDGVTFSESASDTYDHRWMFCFPCNAGDTIECNASGAGSFKSYFRPLF